MCQATAIQVAYHAMLKIWEENQQNARRKPLAVGLKSVHAVGGLVDYGLLFSCNLLTSVNAGGLVFSFR